MTTAGTDFEAQYNNRARVPEHPEIIARWQADAAAYREDARAELDAAYGDGARQRLDLFYPADPARDGARPHLFIHGGYWQALDKSAFSHIARVLNDLGLTVAIASYTLCPETTVAGIVDEMRTCAAWLLRRFAAPLTVSGHSAGGHLTAELLATDWPSLDAALPPRAVSRGIAVSGLFDLRPLVHTSINTALGLDEASAEAVSPALRPAPAGTVLTTLVGELESDEFHRQNVIIRDAWQPGGTAIDHHVVAGANHFTVLDSYADPDGAICRAL